MVRGRKAEGYGAMDAEGVAVGEGGQEGGNATALATTEEVANGAKKGGKREKAPRLVYYMVCGTDNSGCADSVLGHFRSRKSAVRWTVDNRMLLARLTSQFVVVKARNVPATLDAIS